MNLAEFNFQYSRTYQWLLVGACAAMLVSGLFVTLVQPHARALGFGFSNLTMATPAAQVTTVPAGSSAAHLTVLPGGDGSASPAEAAALSGSGSVIGLGEVMNDARFGAGQWGALDALWSRESHWNPAARNAHSGACGIPQALPCSKMADSSPAGQIAWGLGYIAARYGTPSNAWAHEQRHGWY